jgi:hypothetical protein
MTAEELEMILSNVPPDALVEFHYRGRDLIIGDHFTRGGADETEDTVMILEMM